MKMILTIAVLLLPVSWLRAAESPAFKVIEVHQSGGMAGVNTSYRITSDGKFTYKAREGASEGQLDAKDLEELSKAVAAIDWKKLPAELRERNVADDFNYDMQFEIGNTTHHVNADGVAASKNVNLKPILMTLNKIQRASWKKTQ